MTLPKSIGVQVLILGLLLYPSLSRRGSAQDLDLATIIAAVEFYDTSIRSISGRYQCGIVPKPHYRPAPGSLVMEQFEEDQIFKLDTTKGWLFIDEREFFYYSGISKTKRFASHTVNAFDGELSYALIHSLSESPLPMRVAAGTAHQLNIFGRNTANTQFGPWHLAAIRLRQYEVSLAHFLKANQAALEGRQKIGDAHCYLVTALR